MRYDDAVDSLVETPTSAKIRRLAAIAAGWGMSYAELLGNIECVRS